MKGVGVFIVNHWAWIIGMLSVIIVMTKKFFPQFFAKVDPYFKKGAVILDEVDDIVEAIAMEIPENMAIRKPIIFVSDFLDRVLEELKQAGYAVNKKQQIKKIEYRVKAQLQRKESVRLIPEMDRNDFKIEMKIK